ncbi:MAG: nitronate monooxygenase [Syntrophales bacterium]|nr:nitronate monooxygenase [Syntrophales bacterium]
MLKTKMTEILNIEHPIMQGGMLWVSRAELVSAVSNAGALGTLTALTFASGKELAKEIEKTRNMTDRPFAVNVTLLPTFRDVNYDEILDVIISEGIKIVETAGNNPERVIERLKANGITVIHKCTSVRHALKAQSLGCDFVSIDSFECAGHPGEDDVGGLVLIPAAANALNIPIIASGGFADGRGLVAALALGASGINMGTRFLLTEESPVHRNVKEWLIKFSERDTMILLRAFRNSLRVAKTPYSLKVMEMEKSGATIDELHHLIAGSKGQKMFEVGTIDEGIVSIGQCIGLIKDIPTVKELVDRIIGEAKEIINEKLKVITKN